MTKRPTSFEPSSEPPRQRSTLLQKRPNRADVEEGGFDVAQTVLRVPRVVMRELDELARARGISRNRQILAAIDEHLLSQGRPGVTELAPWISNYLDRRPNHN